MKIADNWHYIFRNEGIFDEIERFKPDTVAKKIKKLYPSIIVIGGGQYLTMFSKETLQNGFDFVVREKSFRPIYKEGTKRSDIFCISMFSLLHLVAFGVAEDPEGDVQRRPVAEVNIVFRRG